MVAGKPYKELIDKLVPESESKLDYFKGYFNKKQEKDKEKAGSLDYTGLLPVAERLEQAYRLSTENYAANFDKYYSPKTENTTNLHRPKTQLNRFEYTPPEYRARETLEGVVNRPIPRFDEARANEEYKKTADYFENLLREFANKNPQFNQILQKLKTSAPDNKYSQKILDALSAHLISEDFLMELTDVLSTENWRARVDSMPENANVMQILEAWGVKRWDDPTYVAYYVSNGKKLTSQELGEATNHLAVTGNLVTEFLGKKAGEEVISGKYAGNLKHSIGKVYENLRLHIQKLVNGELDREGCIYILSQLRAEHVKEGTPGEQALTQAIEALGSKAPNFSEETIEARIWKRDPWEDLGYSEEFHCCAFCVKDKAVRYLKDKGVTMLDLISPKSGKLCRAILTPMIYGEPGLLVDSFEGTDKIDFEMAHQAIRDYAMECNFKFIAYNRNAFNPVPQKFISYLESKGLPTRDGGTILARSGTYIEYYNNSGCIFEQLNLETEVQKVAEKTAIPN
jgi:hypothetical protein